MRNAKKREWLPEAGLFVALVTLGVGLAFTSPPSLFAWLTASGRVPLAVMAISDCFIGGYAWQVTVVVYASLALPVALRGPLRRWMSLERDGRMSAVVATAGVMTCALGSSLIFYLTTNLACWIWFDTDHTVTGLLSNYLSALPFYRYTVTGDLLFAVVLFGSLRPLSPRISPGSCESSCRTRAS